MSERVIGITPSSIRRIARRAGIARLNEDAYAEVMRLYDAFIGTIVHETCVHARHARRTEIGDDDVRATLRARNIVVYH